MEERLLEYLDEIVEALKSGVSFVGDQAPIFITEILTYYTVVYSVWSVVCLVVTVFFVWLVVITTRALKDNTKDQEGLAMLGVVSTLFSVIFFIVTIVNVIKLLKVLIAPRLFLLEKVADLL